MPKPHLNEVLAKTSGLSVGLALTLGAETAARYAEQQEGGRMVPERKLAANGMILSNGLVGGVKNHDVLRGDVVVNESYPASFSGSGLAERSVGLINIDAYTDPTFKDAKLKGMLATCKIGGHLSRGLNSERFLRWADYPTWFTGEIVSVVSDNQNQLQCGISPVPDFMAEMMGETYTDGLSAGSVKPYMLTPIKGYQLKPLEAGVHQYHTGYSASTGALYPDDWLVRLDGEAQVGRFDLAVNPEITFNTDTVVGADIDWSLSSDKQQLNSDEMTVSLSGPEGATLAFGDAGEVVFNPKPPTVIGAHAFGWVVVNDTLIRSTRHNIEVSMAVSEGSLRFHSEGGSWFKILGLGVAEVTCSLRLPALGGGLSVVSTLDVFRDVVFRARNIFGSGQNLVSMLDGTEALPSDAEGERWQSYQLSVNGLSFGFDFSNEAPGRHSVFDFNRIEIVDSQDVSAIQFKMPEPVSVLELSVENDANLSWQPLATEDSPGEFSWVRLNMVRVLVPAYQQLVFNVDAITQYSQTANYDAVALNDGVVRLAPPEGVTASIAIWRNSAADRTLSFDCNLRQGSNHTLLVNGAAEPEVAIKNGKQTLAMDIEKTNAGVVPIIISCSRETGEDEVVVELSNIYCNQNMLDASVAPQDTLIYKDPSTPLETRRVFNARAFLGKLPVGYAVYDASGVVVTHPSYTTVYGDVVGENAAPVSAKVALQAASKLSQGVDHIDMDFDGYDVEIVFDQEETVGDFIARFCDALNYVATPALASNKIVITERLALDSTAKPLPDNLILESSVDDVREAQHKLVVTHSKHYSAAARSGVASAGEGVVVEAGGWLVHQQDGQGMAEAGAELLSREVRAWTVLFHGAGFDINVGDVVSSKHSDAPSGQKIVVDKTITSNKKTQLVIDCYAAI